jgi:sialate O-acetylesterase
MECWLLQKKAVLPLFPILLAFSLVFSLSLVAQPALANVKLPSIFSDDMVLQANANPEIFGTADPGEQVLISFAGHKFSTHADQKGNWEIPVGLLKTRETGDLRIEGKNKVVFKNVIAGEVWLCAGQSNMAFPVSKCTNAHLLLSEKQNDEIRFYFVPPDMSNQPLADASGSWRKCDRTQLPGNSAVAYMFAVNLQKALNSPVGIIQSAYGGSSIKTWISKDVLDRDHNSGTQLVVKPNTPASFMQYAIDKNRKERLLSSQKDKSISLNLGQPLVPCTLFNAMINPFIRFQIKGIAWYQGEADAEEAPLYDKLFPAMIVDWRRKWKQENLPFLFVQLPNFEIDSYCKPTKDAWARFRDVQAKALKVHDTAMILAIDQGDAHDLHPPNKTIVAKRLSQAALQLAYKKKGYEVVGPCLVKIQRDQNKLICNFKNASGLHSKNRQPVGFEICSGDGKFIPATAAIKGQNIVLSNPQVRLPVAARYAWANNPQGNVYNNYDLPAMPFRATTASN